MRILVFRPGADAERTARAIRARGHEPVLAPLFEVARLPATAPEGPFDALVLTSGNGVSALADAPASWRELPVFTVGSRTAARAREAGFGDARSADGNRDDLVALLRSNLAAPAKLLLIVGRDRHEDLPGKLAEAGFEIVEWVAYSAEAVAVLPEAAIAALRDHGAEAALHYSPRGARTFMALARDAGLSEEARALTHVALSADVAAPLIAGDASTVLVAEYPEEAGLLAALEEVSAHGQKTPIEPVSPEEPVLTRRGSRRTPPTIDLAKDAEAAPSTEDEPAPAGIAPEAVLPTEALPREYTPGPDRTEPPPPPAAAVTPAAKQRGNLPALALAGLIGGVVGAGLMMLAQNRSAPTVTPEQLATLQGRIDALQGGATALDRRAAAATETATRAATEAQTALTRLAELARTQAPEARSLTDLAARTERAEAAAAALGTRIDQTASRLSGVETLAKTAAAPSTQALAAARVILAERVRQSLADGRPFAGDVAALGRSGTSADRLAALNAIATTGSPAREALLQQFQAHRAVFLRETAPAATNWQDRVLGLASRLVTVRPVGDNGSSDPATLPIRLEAAIAGGDIVAAAALWGQLPEPARRASADFGKVLQQRAAADAAAAAISQDAVAALGVAG